MKKRKKISPAAWVPSLYFTEGLPYVVVMTVSVIMYKRLDVSNTDIALYTSWLYLPWVIKPFWSPFVDMVKTKRWWIIAMQFLIGAGLGGVAFCIPMPFFFQATLAFFWLMAFSSATHDIAADGFYMLELDKHEQSFFVGIRTTSYRLAMIIGQGALIVFAGFLESTTGLEPVEFNVSSSDNTPVKTEMRHTIPETEEMKFVVFPEEMNIGIGNISADSLQKIVSFVKTENEKNGFTKKEKSKNDNNIDKETISWWSRNVSTPLSLFLKKHFGEETFVSNEVGNAGILTVYLTKPPEKGEEVVLNTGLLRGNKAIVLLSGERLSFSSENWNKPAYLAVQLDSNLKQEVTTAFRGTSGNMKFSWSLTFFVLSGLMIALAVYHKFVLPGTTTDVASKKGFSAREFFNVFADFFKKKGIGIALVFMLIYRLGEAQLVKIASPFLVDPVSIGGLGLTTEQLGWAYGTIGIICMLAGGMLGGMLASVNGIGKWLWVMVCCMNLPNLVYVYLSFVQPDSFWVTCAAVGVEQFGYGFGFTAYTLFLLYFSQGKHQTSHYAICTGIMALGMMLPGMLSGWLQEAIGYQHFFIWVCLCTIPGFIIVRFLKIDRNFGKKEVKE